MSADTQLKVNPDYVDEIDVEWFDRAYWLKHSQVDLQSFGRGGAFAVLTPIGRVVIKHYQRGGFAAKVSRDHYVFQGYARSRAVIEFELLQTLRQAGFAVPEPIAARTQRRGLTYHCDLITRELPQSQTLSELARGTQLDEALWLQIGTTIAKFQAAGVYHDDLNAQNVLLSDGAVYLIDFDRGERRKPDPSWQQANIKRLLRSLKKNIKAPWPEALERNVAAMLSAIAQTRA